MAGHNNNLCHDDDVLWFMCLIMIYAKMMIKYDMMKTYVNKLNIICSKQIYMLKDISIYMNSVKDIYVTMKLD